MPPTEVTTQDPPRSGSRVPVTSARQRVVLVVLVVASVVVATWLGIVNYHLRQPIAVDQKILDHFGPRQFSAHEKLLRYVADLGNLGSVGLIVLGVCALAVRWHRPRALVLALLAPPAAAILTEYVFKPWVHRAPYGSDTYPSGHTTSVFAVATVITLVLLGPSAPTARPVFRGVVAAVSIELAAIVGVDLIAAGYHYGTDVIGGVGVGVGTTCLIALLIDPVADRVAARRAPG